MEYKSVSIARITNAIKRNNPALMFINGNKGVSVTKDLNFLDALEKLDDTLKRWPRRVIGVYNVDCPEQWIVDDLMYYGFRAE